MNDIIVELLAKLLSDQKGAEIWIGKESQKS